jgi:hypothetical protein
MAHEQENRARPTISNFGRTCRMGMGGAGACPWWQSPNVPLSWLQSVPLNIGEPVAYNVEQVQYMASNSKHWALLRKQGSAR